MAYMNTSSPESSPSPTGSDCDKCILCLGGKGNLVASHELFSSRACACAYHAHPACLTTLYRHDPRKAQQCVMCSLLYPIPDPEAARAAHEATLMEIFDRRPHPRDDINHVFTVCASIMMIGLAAFFIYLVALGQANPENKPV